MIEKYLTRYAVFKKNGLYRNVDKRDREFFIQEFNAIFEQNVRLSKKNCEKCFQEIWTQVMEYYYERNHEGSDKESPEERDNDESYDEAIP